MGKKICCFGKKVEKCEIGEKKSTIHTFTIVAMNEYSHWSDICNLHVPNLINACTCQRQPLTIVMNSFKRKDNWENIWQRNMNKVDAKYTIHLDDNFSKTTTVNHLNMAWTLYSAIVLLPWMAWSNYSGKRTPLIIFTQQKNCSWPG